MCIVGHASRRSRVAGPSSPSSVLAMAAGKEASAGAHDLPSPVARPRGFEPLTFGSVDDHLRFHALGQQRRDTLRDALGVAGGKQRGLRSVLAVFGIAATASSAALTVVQRASPLCVSVLWNAT